MELRTASLIVLGLTLAAIPAAAQVLYGNGPINGTTDAWLINFSYTTSDTFSLLNNSTVRGFNFGAWETPGDELLSVDWLITSEPIDGGTLYASGTASGSNLTDQFVSTNQYGFDIDGITVTGLNVNLNANTTYWLNLQNAVSKGGNPVYWDENSGAGCTGNNGMGGGCPSMAESTCFECDNIPSESFDINGTAGTTPEPGTFVLFGSGLWGVAALRRKRWKSN